MSVASSVAWAFALFSGVFFGSSILRLQYAPHPLDLLGQHRQVELRGVVAGQVAVLQPFHNLGSDLDELLLTGHILVLDTVHLAGARIDGVLPAEGVVPRTHTPRLDLVVVVREHLDEAEFHDAVIHDA